MGIRYKHLLALVLLCCCGVAWGAEEGILQKTQSWLDEVGRGMRKVGEKAGGLFGPGLDIGKESEAAFRAEREFSDQRQTGPSPVVNVANEFGEIHIETWDDRVVQVSAKIVVGAESASVAEEVKRAINISIREQDGAVYIRPNLLQNHQDMGSLSMQVNLYITVPRSAQVVTENLFGDTFIRGVDGLVAVESHFGIVELSDLSGAVSGRLRGEFPARIMGLAQGGHFQLNGSAAEFGQISGTLHVNAFGGSVAVGTLEEAAELDVVSEGSAITLVLAKEGAPDLTATTRFGTITSDLPVTRSEQGARILARHGSPDAQQRIDVSGTFSDIKIIYEGESGVPSQGVDSGDTQVSETIRRHQDVTPYTKIRVEGIIGNIQLEGTDEPGVHIAATPGVRVLNTSKAKAAIEALALRVEHDKTTDQLLIRTVLTADMETLQCSKYRVDLEIRYPRYLPVTVVAEDGLSQVSGNVAPVIVEQAAGAISAERFAGPITLNNKNGGIRVTGGTGAVTAEARYGDTYFERVRGDISVTCVQGHTVIESPGAGVMVRSSLGNVHILATEGVKGNYDVLVEERDLHLALGGGELPKANLKVTVEGGTVDSAYPLSGQILGRRKEEFGNYVGEGAFSMQLEARNGDIVLD